jgi:hypothetical protein
MVCFQTKNTNLGKFCRVLLRKILVDFMTIWSILRPLQIFYGHLVYLVVIWYIFPRFGILDQEKSGNPDPNTTPVLIDRRLLHRDTTQGDQTWQNFAQGVIVNFSNYFENYINSPHFWPIFRLLRLCITFDQKITRATF